MNTDNIARAVARAYCETLAAWFADDPDTLARIRTGAAEIADKCDDAQLAADAWEAATGTEYAGSFEDDDPREWVDRVSLCADATDRGIALAAAAEYDPGAFADAAPVALPAVARPSEA